MQIIHNKNSSGFTLIELLVAITVFAVLAAMAYGGLNQVLANSDSSKASLQRLSQIQKTMLVLNRDLSQITNRSIRDDFGDPKPSLIINEFDNKIEFTRNGRKNPAQLKRSSLIRVAYQLEENKLSRRFWPFVDRAQNTEPYESELLDNVESYKVRVLDDQNKWHTEWPPQVATPVANQPIVVPVPSAIEFKLKLKDWGVLVRLIRVST